jgi:hypothetical protein
MAEENKDCLQPLIEGKETVLEALARIRETQKKVALATCDELIATAPKYCLQICTYMHERLPRELRDMVYEYTMDTVALDQEDRTVFVQTLEDFEDAPDPEALINKHEKDGMMMTYAHVQATVLNSTSGMKVSWDLRYGKSWCKSGSGSLHLISAPTSISSIAFFQAICLVQDARLSASLGTSRLPSGIAP